MYCKYCGKEIDENSSFCPYCGRNISNNNINRNQNYNQDTSKNNTVSTINSPKSLLATFLFALFLGSFGIHNFYVGKNGKGIVQFILGSLATILNIIGIEEVMTHQISTSLIFGLLIASICEIWVIIEIIIIVIGSYTDKNNLPIKNWTH